MKILSGFKVLLAVIFPMFLLSSCGPSAEEKEAAEKHQQDSVAAAQAQMEAAKEAARQQAIDDSIAHAAEMDSMQVE